MSRWPNDDPRADLREAPGQLHSPSSTEHVRRIDNAPSRGLTLSRGVEGERIECRGREFFLSESEARALATVGAFRVVSPAEVGNGRHDR